MESNDDKNKTHFYDKFIKNKSFRKLSEEKNRTK